VQDGDYLMGRSRVLLDRHFNLIPLRDQKIIRHTYDTLKDMRDNMEDQSGTSQLQRNLVAREYKRHAKKTYKLVKRASERGLDNLLRNRMAEATRPPAPEDGSGNSPGTGTAASDPLSNGHAISRITDINVNNVDRVDVSAYKNEATSDAAVFLDLVDHDESVQRVVATFPANALSGVRTDNEGEASQPTASEPAAISLHRDDGSSPRLIAAFIPDVIDERIDEQGETRTLDSFALSEVATSEGKRPHPVTRASVHPVDGDPYTRSTASRRPL